MDLGNPIRAQGQGHASSSAPVESATPDAVYIKDREGRYLLVNAQAESVLGRAGGELTGCTDADVFGSPGEAVTRADLQLMKRGATQSLEEDPVVVDGVMRVFRSTKTPLRDAEGEVIGLVTILTDLGERERLQEKLRDREAKLAAAQAVARVASWEWHIPANEVVWSPEFYEMLGMNPDRVEPTVEGFLSLIHPDDRSAAEVALSRALDGTDSYAVAHRLIRADGGERMMICRGQVQRDLDGSPLRMVGASLDLTDYMGVAMELRVKHDQLLAGEELAGVGSFHWEVASDTVRWTNGMYRLFGLRRDDFDGTFDGYLQRVHPDDRAARRADLEQLMRDGDDLVADHRIRRGDGAVRWLHSRTSVERDSSGRPVRMRGTCRDITDERAR